MNKPRNIKILNYKIVKLTTKIDNFGNYNISEKKIEKLEILKLKYEAQLEEIQYG